MIGPVNFLHETGFHCGSSAVRKLMRHFGREISEPVCLGLGMAPNLFYLASDHTSPTHYFAPRNPTLEEDFFRVLGVDAPVRRSRDPWTAWEPVRALLADGLPVMIQVDIFHLPYYQSKTHFGGHKVLVVGYDPERGIARLSDSEFPQMQDVTLEQLAAARSDPTPPWDLACQWWDLRDVPAIRPMKEAVPESITETARRMARNESGLFGLPAMRRMEADLPRWADAPDWRWCARFSYQIIERRGTGGGAFRAQYANFLEECSRHDPRIRTLRLVERMHEIAACWTHLAAHLKAISEHDEPAGFDDAQILFEEIMRLEEEFYEDVLESTVSETAT